MMIDIKGYEDKYAIDKDGNVWSKNYRQTGKMKKLKASPDGCGYLMVGVCKDGKRKMLKIHKLLAQYYLPDYSDDLVVDHIDQDKQNNCLSNLRMVTRQQNAFNTKAKGYTFRKDKKTKPWQGQIMKDGKAINLGYFATKEEARQAYLKAKETLHAI